MCHVLNSHERSRSSVSVRPRHSFACNPSVSSCCLRTMTRMPCRGWQGPSWPDCLLATLSLFSPLPTAATMVTFLPHAHAELASTPGPLFLLFFCRDGSSFSLDMLGFPSSFCSLLTVTPSEALLTPPLMCTKDAPHWSTLHHITLLNSLHSTYCSLELAYLALWLPVAMFVFHQE